MFMSVARVKTPRHPRLVTMLATKVAEIVIEDMVLNGLSPATNEVSRLYLPHCLLEIRVALNKKELLRLDGRERHDVATETERLIKRRFPHLIITVVPPKRKSHNVFLALA